MRIALLVGACALACALPPFINAAETPATRVAQSDDRFHFAGDVVDAHAKPVAGARVIATHRDPGGGGFGYVDTVLTDAQGHFAIDRDRALSGARRVDVPSDVIRLDVRHPDHAYARIEDLRFFTRDCADHLGISLTDGRTVGGRVFDPAKHPVQGALVEIDFKEDSDQRRGILSDANGRFVFHGLPSVPATINVLTYERFAPALTGHQSIDARAVDIGEIALIPIPLPPKIVHELFGMKLMDVDGQLQASFHLPRATGVVILDAGPQNDRLKIGPLERGDLFWMVGSQPVRDFAEFKKALLAAGKSPDANEGIRIVYNFRRPDFAGTNTQYLRLSDTDRAELSPAK